MLSHRPSPVLRWTFGLLLTMVTATIPGCSGAPANGQQSSESAAEETYRNRLADETSPYLLLHAHNPVDWYPWGEEALKKARQEKKLIFLSIGYSSCHWCHVMERESFLDKEIAEFLNKHFVCIKVDREERPDIDFIYMTSLQVFNQLSRSGRGGGWPLSMFLTPDAEPFFGGTYFPARDGDRGVSTGFLTILKKIQEVWSSDAEKIQQDATTLTRFVKLELEGRRGVALAAIDSAMLDKVLASLASQYDPTYGGFGYDPANPMRPKFPEPSNLFFLLDRIRSQRAANQDDAEALKMLVGTLQRMAMGGIRDHLGGGFHRYSVDRFWQIPHFEKMLYDNGQLASVYAEAYRLTGREQFKRVVDELAEFVLRELTSEQGGFYSALDAESDGEEGKFYRWQRQEIQQLLSEDQFQLLAAVYGLEGEPNFEQRYYALQLEKPLGELAQARQLSEQQLEAQLAPLRQKLFEARSKRARPMTDTKILTSWNGLMIRGLADAGRVLENERYLQAAARAANFVLENLRTSEGRLLRTYSQGQAKLNAYLNDYAFLVDGLIALYRATDDRQWLVAAEQLTDIQIQRFWDEKQGGFFFTSDDHESLLARSKNPIDGAQPSGNSVAAANLIYLGRQMKRPEYLEKAEKTIQSVSALLQTAPAAAPRMAVAVAQWLRQK